MIRRVAWSIKFQTAVEYCSVGMEKLGGHTKWLEDFHWNSWLIHSSTWIYLNVWIDQTAHWSIPRNQQKKNMYVQISKNIVWFDVCWLCRKCEAMHKYFWNLNCWEFWLIKTHIITHEHCIDLLGFVPYPLTTLHSAIAIASEWTRCPNCVNRSTQHHESQLWSNIECIVVKHNLFTKYLRHIFKC